MTTVVAEAEEIIREEYDNLALSWDQYFVPATDRARQHMIQLAGLKAGERVLDIGTGTGAAAILAANKVGRKGKVLGIDVSRRMVNKARRKAARLRLANVQFRVMNSTSPKLPNNSFDAIITSFGAPEGLYDASATLKKWFRVLAPHGRLCFCEGGDGRLFQVINRIMAKYKVVRPNRELAKRRRLKTLLEEKREITFLRTYFSFSRSTMEDKVRARLNSILYSETIIEMQNSAQDEINKLGFLYLSDNAGSDLGNANNNCGPVFPR